MRLMTTISVSLVAVVVSGCAQVEDDGNIATLSTKTSAGLYSATRSIVLFGEEGRFFRFDAASGTRSLVIEAGPQGLWANDGIVVFSLGGGKIYRIQQAETSML